MDGTDPIKRQYFMLSLALAVLFSFAVNFFFVNMLKGSLLYGFPFSLEEATGITAFFYKLLNSIIYSLVFSVPIYYGLIWLADRTRY